MISKPIHYPQEFVERVVSALPDKPEMRGLLESGSVFSVEMRLKERPDLLEEWRQIFDSRPKIPQFASGFSF